MTSLYQALKAAGVPLDNHESDLYAKVTKESQRILKNYPDQTRAVFKSQVDGQLWYDLAFAYEPFWEAKNAR